MRSRCAGSKAVTSWRLLGSLELFAPQALLAIALGDAQFKRLVLVACRHAPVMGLAAVADDDVAYPEVKQPVKKRRADQNHPRPPLVIEVVRDDRPKARDRQDGQAQPVGEILLLVEFRVATEDTGGQRVLLRRHVQRQEMIARRALPIHGPR